MYQRATAPSSVKIHEAFDVKAVRQGDRTFKVYPSLPGIV